LYRPLEVRCCVLLLRGEEECVNYFWVINCRSGILPEKCSMKGVV